MSDNNNNNNSKRPEHIKKEWFKLLARLQGMSNQHPRASAIYKTTILVDSNGMPQLYTRPRVIVLEPGSIDSLSRIRQILNINGKEASDEQVVELLELLVG